MNKHERLAKVTFVCPQCGNEQETVKRRSRKFGTGHVKHLWCVRCQERTGHVQK